MKKQLLKLAVLMLVIAAAGTACKKDKGETNEEEVITTVQLTFTPQGGGTPLVYDYDDADGPGGSEPVIDQIILAPSTSYNVSVAFLNKTANPVEDVTEEVEEENTAHRVYFEPSAASGITVTNLDEDDNGVPLGLNSVWTTAATGTGTLTVTLRHYPAVPPNKAANDPVDSQKSGTDAEAPFTTKIQ